MAYARSSADEVDGQQTSDLEHGMRIGAAWTEHPFSRALDDHLGRPSGRPERRLHVRASKTGGTL
jgi:hypothetical protein